MSHFYFVPKPLPSSLWKLLSLSAYRSQAGSPVPEAEWSESRSTEPLHPGIKILSQEVRNLGQAKSLSAASLEELKGDKSTNKRQTNHKAHFGGNGWATMDFWC